jgi:predicted transposase YbfD/YdcC
VLAAGGSALSALLASFQRIHDPRAQGQVKHLLAEVLLVALFALVSDCDDFTDMASFAHTQLDWLRRYLPLVNGAPSHDTFRYVFSLVKPDAIVEIMAQSLGPLPGKHLRIDGKVSRGAKNTETGRSCLHLMRAWVSEAGLSAGQAVCDDKTNELATLPAFLASLELKGTLTSIDAMAGHPHIAQQIHEQGGDWLLALKANEKESMTTVVNHFQALSGQNKILPEGVPPATTLHPAEVCAIAWPASCDVFVTEELNRGRYERRETIVVKVEDSWFPKGFLWYGIQSAICTIRTTMRQRHGSEFPCHEVHYHLASLAPKASVIALGIRGHWGVENPCHHLLDVTFNEDHCQVRDRTSAHNFTLMRELSAKLLKDHPSKGSIRGKRKKACLSSAFRSEIVDPIFHNPHA